MSLCYTPKAFSCSEEIKYNINHCLELAPSFPKMYNITMFGIAKLQSEIHLKIRRFSMLCRVISNLLIFENLYFKYVC